MPPFFVGGRPLQVALVPHGHDTAASQVDGKALAEELAGRPAQAVDERVQMLGRKVTQWVPSHFGSPLVKNPAPFGKEVNFSGDVFLERL